MASCLQAISAGALLLLSTATPLQSQLQAAQAPRPTPRGTPELTVVSVPWRGNPDLAHEVYSGGSLVLQGVVASQVPGCSLVRAEWDPGDGSGLQAVPLANPRALELRHTYSGVVNTPYTARIEVEDSCGNVSADTFRVRIAERTLDVEVNMAIDHGLWHLHKRQVLATVGTEPTGFWDSQSRAAATASCVQAYEVHNHNEVDDRSENPYVDDVARGLAHLMTELRTRPINAQPAGDPEELGHPEPNGIGLEDTAGTPYITGQIIDAIAASGTAQPAGPGEPGRAVTGGPDVLGRTYGSILQDLLDSYHWGQSDHFLPGRGGWRYAWQLNQIHDFPWNSDNSAAQWWAIGALAGIPAPFSSFVPQFVKDENLDHWLSFSQTLDGSGAGLDGQFGYTRAGHSIDVQGMNTTPSGMIQLIVSGVEKSDPRWVAAERFMTRNWLDLTTTDRIYGMFAAAKAMRLALPEEVVFMQGGYGPGPTYDPGLTLDWYASDTRNGDAVDGLARRLVDTQQLDGSWDGGRWVFDDLATSWALIILSSTITLPQPVAVCAAEPEVTAVGVPIVFDGRASFHENPARTIARYEWDYFDDGTVDATGPVVTRAFDMLDPAIRVRLTVIDDDNPPSTDSVICIVSTVPPPIPPNSDPGGPYVLCLGSGRSLVVDGSNSSDPDGAIVSYGWDFTPQPLDQSFDDAGTPTVDLTALLTGLGPGVYDLGLRVTDDSGDSNVDFTTIRVFGVGECEDGPPVCNPGGPYQVQCAGLSTTVQLDASASFDPEGQALSFFWETAAPGASFDDPTLAAPRLTLPGPGVFSVDLTVDDGVAKQPTSCSVEVEVFDHLPPTIQCDLSAVQVPSTDGTPGQPGLDDEGIFQIDFATQDACGGAEIQTRLELTCDDLPIDSGDRIWMYCGRPDCSVLSVDGIFAIRDAVPVLHVSASDLSGNRASCRLELCPLGEVINSAPVFSQTPTTVAQQETTYVSNAAAFDPDGDPVTYRLDQAPAGMSINADGLILWTPLEGQTGKVRVAVTASDDVGGSSTSEYQIAVGPPANRAPEFLGRPYPYAAEGQPFVYRPRVVDPEGDQVTLQLVEGPPGMHLDADGSSVLWTPTSDQNGPHQLVMRAFDGQPGGVATQVSQVIAVDDLNSNPRITSSLPDARLVPGVAFRYPMSAEDADGDRLRFELARAPHGVKIDPSSGLLEWPRPEEGTHRFTVQVSDGRGGSDSQAFQVLVGGKRPARARR